MLLLSQLQGYADQEWRKYRGRYRTAPSPVQDFDMYWIELNLMDKKKKKAYIFNAIHNTN